MVTAETRTAVNPRFDRVTTCAGLAVPTVQLPKFTLPGVRLPIVPVPVSETVCGLPLALSDTETVPVTVPFTAGVKVTEIVQLAPAASGDTQLLV